MRPNYRKFEIAVKRELEKQVRAWFPNAKKIVVHGSRRMVGRLGVKHQIDVSATIDTGIKWLIIAECKHRKRRIEKKDVMYFKEVKEDLGAHLGLMFTTLGFQEGAKTVADQYRIKLILQVKRKRGTNKWTIIIPSTCVAMLMNHKAQAEEVSMATQRPASRASAPVLPAIKKLGPLAELPGVWTGTGFNLIARPDLHNHNPFFLEINGTIETLEFTRIGGDIPNRGSQQDDIFLHGVHYLQQVADCATHGALHVEPGLWLFVPATTDPPVPDPTVVRHATIPHGDSLLAQGKFLAVNGPPQLDPVDSFPFTDPTIPDLNKPAQQILGPPYTDQYTNRTLPKCCLPDGLDLNATVKNPVLVLQAAIKGQTITHTFVLIISTAAVAGSTGILNIPFVVRNANAIRMDAIFWIETVQPATGDPFMQLQYVQRVILDFPAKPNGQIIHWPHISVATLVKQ